MMDQRGEHYPGGAGGLCGRPLWERGSRPCAQQRLIMSQSHGREQALQAGHAGGPPEGPGGGEAEAGRVLGDHAGTHGGPRRKAAPCGGGFTKGNTTKVLT